MTIAQALLAKRAQAKAQRAGKVQAAKNRHVANTLQSRIFRLGGE